MLAAYAAMYRVGERGVDVETSLSPRDDTAKEGLRSTRGLLGAARSTRLCAVRYDVNLRPEETLLPVPTMPAGRGTDSMSPRLRGDRRDRSGPGDRGHH